MKRTYFLALLCMAACGGGAGSEFSPSPSAQPNSQSSAALGIKPPALPASIASDYLAYERQLSDIEQVYGDRPVALNSGALWYKSLS